MDEGDFESLLDAAFGLDGSDESVVKPDRAAPGQGITAAAAKQQTTEADASYLSSSPSPSPAASPVHTYPNWVPSGSPCVSDVSMQMHASPPHDSNGSEQQYDPHHLLYSPVREGTPVPEETQECVPAPGTASQPAGSMQQEQQQGGQACQQEQQQGGQPVFDPPATSPAPAARQRTGSTSRAQQRVSLGCLPREVQMRVLCFLSADSLTSLAQTCSQFSSLCGEPVLWRRLFVHRWGKNVRHSNAQGWKVRYMERDAAELQAAGAGAQHRDVMQDIFLQAHRAKRHKALGIGAVDDLMLVEDDEVAARVLAWRKSRGFVTLSASGSDAQPQRPADITPPQGVAAGRGSGHRAAACAAGDYGAAAGAGAGAGSGARRVVRRSAGGSSGGAVGNTGAADAAGSAAATAGAGASGGSQVQAMAAVAAVASQGSTAAGASQDAAAAAAATTSQQPGASGAAVAGTAPAAAAAAAAASGGGGSGGSSSRGVKRRRRSRQPRRWTQIGNVFCDEQTGWVHVCDETCSEKIVEPSSGLLVCPISGTCSARFLTCAEEDEEEGDRDPEKEHREEEFGGERGRLARAFAAGYYCSDERELMRECGVYLPR